MASASTSKLPRLSAPSAKRTPSGQQYGLRSQLAQLISKHALFHVRLVIHELSSVPLVHGDFGVRWRFHAVQRASGGGLLAKMRGARVTAPPSPLASSPHLTGQPAAMANAGAAWKGKGKVVENDEAAEEMGTRPHRVPGEDGVIINVVDTTPDEYGRGFGEDEEDDEEEDHERARRPHALYLDPGNAASRSVTSLNSPAFLTPTAASEGSMSDGRGMTPYVRLHEHSVHWEQTVDVVVQMGVNRETTELLPNELKLTVEQVSHCAALHSGIGAYRPRRPSSSSQVTPMHRNSLGSARCN